MTRRRAFLLVHRVNGLFLAAFLLVVSLSGCALAWRMSLERLCAPRLFRLPAHGTQRLDPLQVRAHVESAYPAFFVDTADLATYPDDPLEFTLQPRPGPQASSHQASPPPDDDVFADPYAGRVLGARRRADLRQGLINLAPFLEDLHEQLALGDRGALFLGLVSLLWTIDCFIGLYLTFPATHRRSVPRLVQRFTQWPARFLPAFFIRWSARGFRRLYDLHRAPGLWLWPLLLVFAWTGVVFNLPAVANPVTRLAGGTSPSVEPSAPCLGSATPDWDDALHHAQTTMAGELQRRHAIRLSERFLSYDRDTCRWTYRVRSTLDLDHIGNTQITWRTAAPGNYAFQSPMGTTRTDAATTWIEAVHEAQLGEGFRRTLMRLLVTAVGLGTAALSITGTLIFLRKVRRPRTT